MVMEDNRIISQELEEMRSQISLLKDKLEKQTIVNAEHIKRSVRSKMSEINRTVTATIFIGTFALIYCTWFFASQGCSIAFTCGTGIMLAVCLALTIIQRINLGKIDFSQGNIVETARSLSKVKTHYQEWYKVAIPMIVVWLAWLIYEMSGILGWESPIAIGFYCGAGIGVIIGGIAGSRINRKIIGKATEILDQIEELQKEE